MMMNHGADVVADDKHGMVDGDDDTLNPKPLMMVMMVMMMMLMMNGKGVKRASTLVH